MEALIPLLFSFAVLAFTIWSVRRTRKLLERNAKEREELDSKTRELLAEVKRGVSDVESQLRSEKTVAGAVQQAGVALLGALSARGYTAEEADSYVVRAFQAFYRELPAEIWDEHKLDS